MFIQDFSDFSVRSCPRNSPVSNHLLSRCHGINPEVQHGPNAPIHATITNPSAFGRCLKSQHPSFPLNTAAQPSAQALLDQALQASRTGDASRAIELFQAAANAAPANAMPRYLLGTELAAAGNMQQAEAALAQAVLLDPALHMARFQLGLLQFTERRVAVAMMTWQPLYQLPATAPLQRFVTGLAALARDDFDEARARLLEGIAANTENAPLNADMRMVLARIDAVQQGASSAPANAVEADEPQGDDHILLANYRQQGGLN